MYGKQEHYSLLYACYFLHVWVLLSVHRECWTGLEMEMEFDASDMSMDIVPSLEDTIELLAKLGKNLATGDRP